MVKELEQTFLQREYMICQQEYEKMLNITTNKGKASQNHINMYLRPVEMAIIKKLKKSKNNKWQGCKEKETLVHCSWKCNSVQPYGKEVPQKLKTELLFDPAMPLLRTYPKEIKSLSWIDIFTPRFIATWCMATAVIIQCLFI